MKSEDMFVAVGHMDEEFLADSQILEEKKPRRILWRTILVAAIIASLAISAAAAIYYQIAGFAQKEPKRVGMTINGKRTYVNEEYLDVYIDWEVAEFTQYLDQIWIPGALTIENLEGLSYGHYEDPQGVQRYNRVFIQWTQDDLIPSKQATLELLQWGTFGYDPEKPIDDFYRVSWPDHSSEIVLLGEREYFLLRLDSEYDDDWYYLYWTDGSYFFRLQFPEQLELTQVQQIAESLAPVDSLQPYEDELQSRDPLTPLLNRYSSLIPYEFRAAVEKGWLEERSNGAQDVWLEVAWNENAPDKIQRIVYPRRYRDRAALSGHQEEEDGLVSMSFCWEMPEYGEKEYMYLFQYSKYYCDWVGRVTMIYEAASDDEITEEIVSWDDNRAYMVSYPRNQNGKPGWKYLFWSDGDYVYQLTCPYAMELEEIQKIIESMDGT